MARTNLDRVARNTCADALTYTTGEEMVSGVILWHDAYSDGLNLKSFSEVIGVMLGVYCSDSADHVEKLLN